MHHGRSLRIALFTYSTQPRGSVIHTIELGEALHDLGQDVCIYALDKDGLGFDRFLSCPVVYVPTQIASNSIDALIQQRIHEFVAYFQEFGSAYDCYHAQDCLSANALVELKHQGRITNFVRTIHHIEEFNSPYLRDCQDRSIHEPDLCLCVSSHWQTELQQRYRISAMRVFNGVNHRRFSSGQRSQADLERWGLTGFPVYLTVGGIEPRKNSIRLLQAFAQVLTHFPQAQLMIAGGATLFDYQTYRDEFFTVANDLGIDVGRSLLLPGVIADSDLPSLYRTANAFVFPSVQEGWGLVVLEAIASGIPVVTANQPPFTEFLSADQALLVDPTSIEAIAQAMMQVVEPDLAQSLIRNSQSVVEQYTWEKSATQHLHYYQQMLLQAIS
jgi:glycosyltransferase-like protein